MFLFSVESGTQVLIDLKNGSPVIKAEFAENYDNKIFYVQSRQIYENMDGLKNKEVSATIFFREGFYSAGCRIKGIGKKGRYGTVEFEALREFEYNPQRGSPRVNISADAEIYNYSEDKNSSYKGNLAGKAKLNNLSRDGVSLLVENKINEPEGTMFTISFYFSSYTFAIPARLVRNKKNGASVEYGFKFDFSDLPELQDKLFVAVCNEKIGYSAPPRQIKEKAASGEELSQNDEKAPIPKPKKVKVDDTWFNVSEGQYGTLELHKRQKYTEYFADEKMITGVYDVSDSQGRKIGEFDMRYKDFNGRVTGLK